MLIKIGLCLGTACYVRGGKALADALKKEFGVEEGGTTPDRKFYVNGGIVAVSSITAQGGFFGDGEASFLGGDLGDEGRELGDTSTLVDPKVFEAIRSQSK